MIYAAPTAGEGPMSQKTGLETEEKMCGQERPPHRSGRAGLEAVLLTPDPVYSLLRVTAARKVWRRAPDCGMLLLQSHVWFTLNNGQAGRIEMKE